MTDVSDETLARWLAEHGEPPYRARQIRRSVARSAAADWSGLTDLPLALRSKLAEAFRWSSVELETEIASADGETRKALLRLHDGHHVETVLMPHHGERDAVCISSQVGCPMACAFCATGEMGWIRDLTAGEIVDQVRFWQRELRSRDARVSHVDYMGMGEPLRNYAPVMASVRLLTDVDMFGISPRRITVSTCGIVPKMDDLAAEGIPINLAVSLHAADDATRTRIMPVGRKWDVDELLAACARYVERTKRRLTFEYILLAGVNDSAAHAERLARKIAGLGRTGMYHVNLIPVNPGAGDFARPSPEKMERFAGILERHGIAATVRISKGQDIAAGCGQLKVAEGRAAAAV
ncbi:MAG: 23S rRNA (adenine(2503)-C(2))-methyltransferase RlmN [Chloroflexota bacterium]|nr:23S rRNA (adenine(2503)-C(2))-methyltransferase RlmN [Chloroflexota bacterium]MDE3192231.1 23S rRNA (adenine(2503)-C(2))-methyltransferase RlmN [Chloroflexota bacterium]